ncbi:11850_t:CDS:10 [Funneliformis geosporum]|uniref:14715_t:CDS:1 n=1 Tax=Funneliformis geosporum TaxID=1117311 RepID=A0A9W4SFN0_9GLOM|nr:14715_t:CDS:10 [Funneliformis geosporum]CAI2170019.1 11850_t:CDS:10 [Funneliformis geosporum]
MSNTIDEKVPEIIIEQRSLSPSLVKKKSFLDDNASDASSIRGKERFKAVTKKVIAVQRLLSADQIFSVGQDPGIDPRTVDYDLHTKCDIFCSDFSEECAFNVERLSNESLEAFLQKPRPSESKVRWINVDGISWDVIKTLAIHYDLHPLAIEDTLQSSQRTKLDQYKDHIYISLLLHTLVNSEKELQVDNDDISSNGRMNSRQDLLHHGHREDSKYLEAHRIFRRQKLYVAVETVNIFLLTNDILLTIFQYNGKQVYKPILSRIHQPKTLLRTVQDSSLLMEAVIDAIDSYRHQIAELEGRLLIRPKMYHTHELHMISGELTILKRTLGPIQGLVSLLRKHNDEFNDDKKLISSIAKTYFMDVADHCAEIVDDLDTMTKITESLVNMVFNMISYETNENMRIIAMFSIVFLPMTFIAGYYGMNFDESRFPDLYKPISYFWKVTIPSTLLMFIAGTYSIWTKWVSSFIRYLYKRKAMKQDEAAKAQRSGS